MREIDATGDWRSLVARATSARANAYVPYSRFQVGAALRADDGIMYVGVNVENCAYGSTICAERHAVGAAIVAGARKFDGIAVVTDAPSITTPCGACLQVLQEMQVPVVVAHNLRDNQTRIWGLGALLPRAPELGYLAKNKDAL